MGRTSVQIAVPVIGLQPSQWWSKIAAYMARWSKDYDVDILTTASAMPDDAKNQALRAWDIINGKNGSLTHENRNQLVGGFDADWLFFIDYDTVPPVDALARLLAHNYPFVCGTYYHRNSPHHPLVYRRREDGLYGVVSDYEPGAVFCEPGLATGLGCALIHREVFDRIRAQYKQYMRADGSRFLVHEADVIRTSLPGKLRRNESVFVDGDGGWLVQRARDIDPTLEANRAFPYFDMEHGRTEDLGFCEKAERVGFPVRVDTGIVCDHWHLLPINQMQFDTLRDEYKLAGIMPSEVEA